MGLNETAVGIVPPGWVRALADAALVIRLAIAVTLPLAAIAPLIQSLLSLRHLHPVCRALLLPHFDVSIKLGLVSVALADADVAASLRLRPKRWRLR